METEQADEDQLIKQNNEYYRIPSPILLFVQMRKSGAEYVHSVLSSTDNITHFNTSNKQALNFGVYAADLAYSSVYEDFQASINYFNAARKLAEQLGLYEGYGKHMALRIDENLTNVDSLINISVDSYSSAMQFLESQGLHKQMGLIMAGGWMESLYLIMESSIDNNPNDELYSLIADQQLLLEQLIKFFKQYNHSKQLDKIIADFEELREVFDQLYYNDEEVSLTKKQFVAIFNKVKLLRLSYIQ